VPRNKTMLTIQDLSVIYNTKDEIITAVDTVGLTMMQGESIGIIGESGCGKSSFVLSIMGLINNGSVTGNVMYNDVDLLKLPENKLNTYRWKEIAIVFQNSLEVLNPVLTLKEQMRETIKAHSTLTRKETDEKIIELFYRVGIDLRWEEQYPHQLSGGMRQRVLIAMALACDPKLILIDEPTSAIDPSSKRNIINLLQELKETHGFSMIVISHDMRTVSELTSKIITMYQGRFIEIGPTEEVIRDPAHCYTRGLLNASPELFPHKDLWGIAPAENGLLNRNESKRGEISGCAFSPRCPQRSEKCSSKRPELKYIGVERMVACNKDGIETFLEANNIDKTYMLKSGNCIEAVKGVDISVKSGEVVALVGESGSGKSTLAHILAGVQEADNGKVVFMGREVIGRWATKMMGGMQIVFQDPFSATSSRLTVLEAVAEPLDIIKWKEPEERKERAIEALKNVHLPITDTFLNRLCRNLSGGQRQRIAIARSLVTEPKLLIADEITSMLDPSIQANIIRTLKGLQNTHGFSMLYITHDLYLARKVADKVSIMQEGRIISEGLSSELDTSSETISIKEPIGIG
jgi:peptide/nickel transport system ATP-binding protein